MTQGSSSSIFLPPLPKKRICKSYRTIEVSDSKDYDDYDDNRTAKDFFKQKTENS